MKETIQCPRCGKILGYVDIFKVGIDGAKPAAWDANGVPIAWPEVAFSYLYPEGNDAYEFPPGIVDMFEILCLKCADEVGTRY